ncbi:MAG: (E)-4-hydroxy-3-methylbut-2-enyl-diphosphate synthase [Opitutaceae bacterium]|jgi:(E)-4-hydroxy-3-methylbut-2-enyl-diphosphate synthase
MQPAPSKTYCASRLATRRRNAVEVRIGGSAVGGSNPIRIQSMTTSDTQDVAATVRQCVDLAGAGCEIVRVTAPNVAAAACLREIRSRFSAAGFAHVPLVADIHFLPQAAMEAVEHVEKIRINPGNYADKKKFAVKDYSDSDYGRELDRLHQIFSPLVLRCKELGRSLRIGANHGSLSDRIMNRYGDSPLGMVESALEFVRICESHGFHDLVLSMKSSNPKIVIQAYRLLVSRMDAVHRAYPLHLGVTEAGDGEDGRIKSAIGIGALLLDGLGDTIRVSLTEDSVREIPVARALAEKAMALWEGGAGAAPASPDDGVNPFAYNRRNCVSAPLGQHSEAGPKQPPRVIVSLGPPAAGSADTVTTLYQSRDLGDTPAEGILFRIGNVAQIDSIPPVVPASLVLDLDATIGAAELFAAAPRLPENTILARRFSGSEALMLANLAQLTRERRLILAVDIGAADFARLSPVLQALGDERIIISDSNFRNPATQAAHALGAYRSLVAEMRRIGFRAPLWLRASEANSILHEESFPSRLLEASIFAGGLLCDGLGDILSVESERDARRALLLAYNVLQGAGARISKTEYVACPSCGRTLFDLQSTTQRIKAMTGHLKGVKIAIMGCIVNGPGEMADADFGYVGGAPGKINLYVGKDCVKFNLPETEADSHLEALIRAHGKWTDPRPVS